MKKLIIKGLEPIVPVIHPEDGLIKIGLIEEISREELLKRYPPAATSKQT